MPAKTKSTKKTKTLVIDRKKWKRGGRCSRTGQTTSLLMSSGQMCCLGFLARLCGYSAEEIRSKSSLDTLAKDDGARAKDAFPTLVRRIGLYARANDLHSRIVMANDDESKEMRGPAREKKLKKLFAEADIDVRFK